jgi:hypothetical protein
MIEIPLLALWARTGPLCDSFLPILASCSLHACLPWNTENQTPRKMLCLKTQIDVTAVLLAMLVQWGVREIFVRRPAYYKEIVMLLFLD